MIPTGLIFLWSGTAATIPSGWERETSLDSIFLKGTADGVNPNVTGGASTHSHSASSNHTHTLSSHTHTLSIGGSSGGHEGTSDSSGNCSREGHTHTGSCGSPTGGGLSSASATYDSTSNNPPYHELIFIKPTSSIDGLADLMLSFCADGSFVNNSGKWSGFYKCDGNNSTPNLTDKYPKGCTGDAGGTGGSTTNTHTLTHSHTVSSHTHSYTANATTSSGRDSDSDSTQNVANTHTHSGTSGSQTDTISSTAPSIVNSETVEPSYKKLLVIQNRSGTTTAPTGIIGMWLGTLSAIPGGWTLCDGNNGTQDMRGYYVKMTSTAASIGGTGGSNSHTHASQSHTHSSSGTHSHSATIGHVGAVDRGGTTAYVWIDSVYAGTPVHAASFVATTASYSNDSTSADSASNEPQYRTVAFLEFSSLEIEESENVTLSESVTSTQVYSINVSETVTLSESTDQNIRSGWSIHIWKENINVEDEPQMPGEKSLGNQFEDIRVTDEVYIKLSDEGNESYKPYFMVRE